MTSSFVCAMLVVLPSSLPVSEENRPQRHEVILTVGEVTQPSLSLSPDGKTLVFPLLGDLVAIPAGGGEARQLTNGPAYDRWPVFSPDGGSIYFASDRDDFATNVYRLDRSAKKVIRITERGTALSQLAVAPDKKTFAARFLTGSNRGLRWLTLDRDPSAVPVRLHPTLRWPSFLSDGSLVVVDPSKRPSVLSRGGMGQRPSQIYRAGAGRRIESASLSPSGRYAACRESGPWHGLRPDFEEWVVVDIEESVILHREPLGPYPDSSRNDSRAAVSENKVFLPVAGRIRVFDLKKREISDLSWSATVRLSLPIHPPLRPPGMLSRGGTVKGYGAVRPSRDGSAVAFSLHGNLYLKEMKKKARRLTQGSHEDRLPVFSQDGSKLFFARDGALCTLDLKDQTVRKTVADVGTEYLDYFALSHDEKTAVVLGSFRTPSVTTIDLATGKITELVPPARGWATFPSFGRGEIVFCGAENGVGQIYRHSLESGKTECLTDLLRSASSSVSSPDSQWLGIIRDGRAWLAPRKDRLLTESDLIALGSGGAHCLSFGGDSQHIWLAAGRNVTRYRCTNPAEQLSFNLGVQMEIDSFSPERSSKEAVRAGEICFT